MSFCKGGIFRQSKSIKAIEPFNVGKVKCKTLFSSIWMQLLMQPPLPAQKASIVGVLPYPDFVAHFGLAQAISTLPKSQAQG
jgi:hypothetical protein